MFVAIARCTGLRLVATRATPLLSATTFPLVNFGALRITVLKCVQGAVALSQFARRRTAE
jgi:hypothetical protein